MSDDGSSNIRLRTNIICSKLGKIGDTGWVKERKIPDELVKYLTYFELVSLRNASPYVFSGQYHETENLTSDQIQHRDAFQYESGQPIWESPCDELNPLVIKLKELEEQEELDISQAQSDLDADEDIVDVFDGPSDDDESIDNETQTVYEDPQLEVIQADVKRNLLVLAPPGTGKTHVLVERLVYLLNESFFENPAEEILVLSFSRAVVAEIRSRVVNHVTEASGDNLRYVGVSTFDSYATQILLEHLSEEDLHKRSKQYRGDSFVKRIRVFNDFLSESIGKNSETLSKIRYLVIDEIQDLVCARAKMVTSLIELVLSNNGNVLLLGDPAQAINDYLVNHKNNECIEKIDSRRFINDVRDITHGNMEEVPFAKYFRYSDQKVRLFVENARKAMGPDGLQPDHSQLRRLMYELGEPDYLAVLPARLQTDGKVAVLVRNNVQAFQLYSWCRENNLPVHLHRGVSGLSWPSEISRVFSGWKQDTMRLDTFSKRWKNKVKKDEGVNVILEMLSDLGILKDEIIDLGKLRYVMTTQKPSVQDAGSGEILVSTIHRSKGLEFDSVMVLEPDNSGEIKSEEIRILYVAATRARKRIGLLNNDRSLFKRPRSVGRSGYYMVGSELYLKGADDINPDVLEDGLDFPSGYEVVQDELWELNNTSDSNGINAFLRKKEIGGSIRFSVAISTSSGVLEDVCWCEDQLSNALYGSISKIKNIGDGDNGWPIKITGLSTIVFDVLDEEATGIFGKAGTILVPILESSVSLN